MISSRVYIGIDVGSKGFITVNNGRDLTFLSIADNDIYAISNFLQAVKNTYPDVVCAMEEVHAIFGSSAKATFAFGEINGILKGLLIANQIPYHLIQPKKWQSEIWENKDMVATYKTIVVKGKNVVKKDVNTKQTSFNAAKRIFPAVDLRKTERCKNLDDNKCDSLLICEYARRKNL